jgi:hypothetical protein
MFSRGGQMLNSALDALEKLILGDFFIIYFEIQSALSYFVR